MPRRSLFLLGLCSLVLLGGVVLAVIGMRPPPPRTFQGSVKDLLPKPEEIPGWTIEYQPIADTPEVQAKVNELLNYDDAVYVVYRRGIERLSVYIAYWTPGKMSHRLVAGHTPDVCWVGAGWKKLEAEAWQPDTRKMSSGNPLPSVLASVARLMVGAEGSQSDGNRAGVTMPAAEFRVMSLGGAVESVAFWHLIDGEAKSYGTSNSPPWYASLADMYDRGINQQPEQFFVRISAPHRTLR